MEVWLKVTLIATSEDGDEYDLDDGNGAYDAVADDLVYEVSNRASGYLSEVDVPSQCDCNACEGRDESVKPEVTNVEWFTHQQMRERYRPVAIIR